MRQAKRGRHASVRNAVGYVYMPGPYSQPGSSIEPAGRRGACLMWRALRQAASATNGRERFQSSSSNSKTCSDLAGITDHLPRAISVSNCPALQPE